MIKLPDIATMSYAERFKGRKPRICIGLVAYGAVSPEIVISWAIWSMQTGARYHDKFEVFFAVASKKEQYRARNYLIDQARQVGADFLLQIDDDHTIFDCPDMLEDFYRLEKPIQTALSCQRGKGENSKPTVLKIQQDGSCDFYTNDELPCEPAPVDASGGGCNWCDMWVFDFMDAPFWWPYPTKEQNVTFIPDPRYGLDINFCLTAKKRLGVETWLNTNVVLGHMMNEHEIIRPQVPNRMKEENFAARESFRPAYRQLADTLLSEFSFNTMLDVGSAQGFLVDQMLAAGKDVTGVELEESARAYMSDGAKEAIIIGDATKNVIPKKKWDFVTCVEVAEHLPESRANSLVETLASRSKEYLYFTADDTPSALHVNPQPLSYWTDRFGKHGFAVDTEKTDRINAKLKHNPLPWLAKNGVVLRRGCNNGI
tara:strand:- start:1803 stop:3086 length:1284 start_codon:yes stop_codon:yes gene_type:complete